MATVKRYEDCATRLENRGGHPPTKEYVDALVEGIQESGVEACWHSAVAQNGLPLFPSKVIPTCHKDANFESFHYLIKRLHEIGRPVLSWYPLGENAGLVEMHPDWQAVPMTGIPVPGKISPEYFKTLCCVNTPYGKLLPEFALEIVRDVGFDGIFFDGATLGYVSGTHPGCLCKYCRKRFRHDTGLELPTKADFSSRAFRIWINWRYDYLMEVWKRIVDIVHSVKPEATICFNNSRHRYENFPRWTTGIPMKKLGWDVVMAGELSLQVLQADFQIKMHRAYGCRRGAESWMPLCDHWNMWAPDIEPLPLEQGAVAALSAGGVASMGTGVHPKDIIETISAVERVAAPLMPYKDGETVRYAAIWASQQTQDFYDQLGRQFSWNAYHGANELCLHAHLQASIVFDDHVRDGDISRYPVLLAGNAACIDKEQAGALRRYVENGGILVACHEFGKYDELGYPHETPPLDDFLGIESRVPASGMPTLELIDRDLMNACGKWVTFNGAQHCLASPSSNAELHAYHIDRQQGDWEGAEDPSSKPFPRAPGLWTLKKGKGMVIYSCANFFPAYIDAPTLHMLRFFKALVTRFAVPAITLEGPICVTMNTRVRKDGNWVVHLHNAPGAVYRYPGEQVFNSGELLPIFDLRLKAKKEGIKKAYSGLSLKDFTLTEDGHGINIPRLDRNEVVVIEWK